MILPKRKRFNASIAESRSRIFRQRYLSVVTMMSGSRMSHRHRNSRRAFDIDVEESWRNISDMGRDFNATR